MPKRLTALCPQVVCHHLHPATRTAQPSGEGGGWGEGRQAGTAWHDPPGLTWQEAEGRARRGVDWPWQEPCPSASLSLSSQATGCATILLDPGGTHLEDWSLHGSLLGLRQLNYGLREGGAFGGQRRMKTGACLNWNPAEGRGLAQGWTQASPEPEAALRPLSPLGLPGAWDSPQIGVPGRKPQGKPLRGISSELQSPESPLGGGEDLTVLYTESSGSVGLGTPCYGAEGSGQVNGCPLPIWNPVSSAFLCSPQASPCAWGRKRVPEAISVSRVLPWRGRNSDQELEVHRCVGSRGPQRSPSSPSTGSCDL